MQAKNFDLELLSLHPNWGHGAAELALGNSLRADPCPTLIKLKETDHESSRSQSQDLKHASRKTVRLASTRVQVRSCVDTRDRTSGRSVPRRVTRYGGAFQ